MIGFSFRGIKNWPIYGPFYFAKILMAATGIIG
jgi:hypothetical protein